MSTRELHEVRVIADLAVAGTDQLLVPQSHYVDVLLDLRSVAVSAVLREMIEERLREIRFVTMLDASDVRADLAAIVAISELEDELELSWAEFALTCECDDCASAIDTHEAGASVAG